MIGKRKSHVPMYALLQMQGFTKLDLIEICFDLCMAGEDMDESSFTYEKAITALKKRKSIIKKQLHPKKTEP